MVLDLDTFLLRARRVYSEATLRKKLVVLRVFDRFLEEKGLKPCLESLNLWLDELVKRGLSDGAIRVYFNHVLSYFELMMLEVDERRLRNVRRRLPPYSPGRVDFLTEEEVAKIISETRNLRYRLIFALMYSYARRLGEVLLLSRNDIDLKNNKISFTILKKKREEKAVFDLEPWIKQMLTKYLRETKGEKLFDITSRAVEIAFRKICSEIGIESKGRRLSPHILRHSRLTHLRDRGVPMEIVSKAVARHSRFDTTVQFYRGISEKAKTTIPKAEEIFK